MAIPEGETNLVEISFQNKEEFFRCLSQLSGPEKNTFKVSSLEGAACKVQASTDAWKLLLLDSHYIKELASEMEFDAVAGATSGVANVVNQATLEQHPYKCSEVDTPLVFSPDDWTLEQWVELCEVLGGDPATTKCMVAYVSKVEYYRCASGDDLSWALGDDDILYLNSLNPLVFSGFTARVRPGYGEYTWHGDSISAPAKFFKRVIENSDIGNSCIMVAIYTELSAQYPEYFFDVVRHALEKGTPSAQESLEMYREWFYICAADDM